jgi:alkyldihydroxyacetonephosphate synthase
MSLDRTPAGPGRRLNLGQARPAAKAAAGDAIIGHGGTVTHRHAVGVEVLRAVKTTLHPVGVLNPGKLIPPG